MGEADGPALRGRQGGGAAPPLPQEQSKIHVSSLAGRSRRQSRLHNFSFPSRSWGTQRLFRCVKVQPHGGGGAPSPDRRSVTEDELLEGKRTGASPSPEGRAAAARGRERADGEVEGRGKVVEAEEEEEECLVKFTGSMEAEFEKTFDRIPLPSSLGPPPQVEYSKEVRGPSTSAAGAEASRPWNLRLRRAACNAPAAATATAVENGLKKVQQLKDSKAVKFPGQAVSWPDVDPARKERPRFSSVLSKDEIAEDFFSMTGSSKLPRRPKKRPRNVQRQIEMLYPGFYLCEVMPDLYKMPQDK